MAEPAFDSSALESKNPIVSILIRTKDEEHHIGQTLSVLFSQIYNRSYQQAYAMKVFKYDNSPLGRVLFEMLVGSIYDMFYVLLKLDNIRWFFLAPLRRITMNSARLKAARAVDRDKGIYKGIC